MTLVVPFTGGPDLGREVAERFGAVLRRDGDRVVVADNSPSPAVPEDVPGVDVARAPRFASAGHARNAGAAGADTEWLVFCDADVEPIPGFLDLYFDPPPRPRTAILAGGVVDHPEGDSLAARLARETRSMSQDATLSNPYLPFAITANCGFRTSAFREMGGFKEDIQWGEEADLCWRLQRAGWELEERSHALVHHRNRETMRGLWRQRARHGRGAGWLEHEYPGAMPRWGLAALLRDSLVRLAIGARALVGGRRGQLSLEAAKVSGWWAFELGRRTSNRARRLGPE